MNPKIVSFTEIKGSNTFLGFCGLELSINLNGQLIPIVVKAKVMRNSNNGHVFITIHQEPYKKQDGTTGYSNLIRIPEEKYAEFNKATAKAWEDYILAQNASHSQILPNASIGQSFYPHGLAKNTEQNSFSPSEPQVHKQQRQYKDQDEELPF